MLGLVSLPAAGLGWLLGDRVFANVNGQVFRHLVLTGLTVTAAVTLARAVAG
jgi:hypothetical protein